MRVLLPPSETKRDGGAFPPVDIPSLTCPALAPLRERLVGTLVSLAQRPSTFLRTLGLSPRMAFEVDRAAHLRTSPTLPAIQRYTGVLFDGLDRASLAEPARREIDTHVIVQSALWGPIAATDLIPAYRLSHDSRLPALRGKSLVALWSAAARGCDEVWSGFTLDARSEGYRAMMPPPVGTDVAYLRVVTRDSNGRTRALNHFNKKAKGELVRALAESSALSSVETVQDLTSWAVEHQLEMWLDESGDVVLAV